MKSDHAFVAERALARHCAALVGSQHSMEDDLVACAEAGTMMARHLRQPLCELLGRDHLRLTCSAAEIIAVADLTDGIEPLAANCLVGLFDGGPVVLTSIGGKAALALTDRTFGGNGEAPDPLPDQFPLSADLTLNRLEKALCLAMRHALGEGHDPVVRRRAEAIRRLKPFSGVTECARLVVSVEEDGQDAWHIVVAIGVPDLPVLFGNTLRAPAPSAKSARTPSLKPFANVPLPVVAVLAEVKLPLARVSRLAVGDVIPLCVSRAVPLTVNGTQIACGTIGTLDDRVAVQITRIP
ncbi:FliM/FliN family flagellar motor switch protein [Croceicoccus sp. F390]|uniref:FliM/FliN family flagellar motor switch protein n=1 Tax=Croceicoccus esteveae TaxID=3075597 RepID=A0ABU2ZEH6_9SPHN|nr:FliM/FliN family flagellar motor switch protein [Croceicoccus sp. F390]MDT0574684.1 FliM/FliN family flagellar motor switch protein [Croceicoccus sp. F390]